MKILIIRHAEPDYSVDSLTEKGFCEAELLSQFLMSLNISDVYCSTMGRAQATAKPFLEKSGLSAENCDWLREFGGKLAVPEGERPLPWDILPCVWQSSDGYFSLDGWLGNPAVVKGGAADEYRRVTAEFDNVMKKNYGLERDGLIYKGENSDRTIAFFCHFALGSVLVSHLTGISPVLLWQGFNMPPSAVTTMRTEERRLGEVIFRCCGFGDVSHLRMGGEPVSSMGMFPELYVGDDADTSCGSMI